LSFGSNSTLRPIVRVERLSKCKTPEEDKEFHEIDTK
jgi:hypothetical protein